MLNTAPNSWTIKELDHYLRQGPISRLPNGDMEHARPFGFYSLHGRLRLAWDVFTGKADALYWPGQMPRAY